MANKKARRKKKFIDRHVQGALVARLALHWCAFLVLGMGVSLILQYLANPFKPGNEHLAAFIQNQAGFLLVMACMTPVFLYDTVKLSNRFAGPILRVRRVLSDLARGNKVQPVTFRPGDFWTEITDDLNYVVSHMSPQDAPDASSAPADDSDTDKGENTLSISKACG